MLPCDEAKAIEAAFMEISLVLSPPYLNDDDPDIESEVVIMIHELKRIMYPSSHKGVTQQERLEYESFDIIARRIRHPKKQRLAELVDDLANHFKSQLY